MSRISATGLSKAYRHYAHPRDRFLELLPGFRKQRHSLEWAVRDVSFTVEDGEAVGIIGLNGAGKSTLINKLTGHHICPESMKANTTRSNARAIISEGDTQIVFVDTPGVTDLETATTFKLEQRLLNDPIKKNEENEVITPSIQLLYQVSLNSAKQFL